MKTKGKPDQIDVYVGRRLRELRKAKGFSQMDLAEFLGVRFQQIQKYENGQNRISPGKLYRAAKALGVSIIDFFPEDK